MQLLLDISSRLQATEHYIQTKQKQDAKGGELCRSPHHRAAAPCGQAVSPPQWACKPAIAGLSEEARASVARRLCRSPILTTSTSEDSASSDDETREPPWKRTPLKSGKVHIADSMVIKRAT